MIHFVAAYLCTLGMADYCEDPRQQMCRAAIESSLRSPSTLKIVEVSARPKIDGSEPKPGTVIVKFDAVNAFNAPVRDAAICDFDLDKVAGYRATSVVVGGKTFTDNQLTVFNAELTLKALQTPLGR